MSDLELNRRNAPSSDIAGKRPSARIDVWIGGALFLALIALAIFAPLIAPETPDVYDLDRRLIPPIWSNTPSSSWAHTLGTDSQGRDYLSLLLYGTRNSLVVGLLATLISSVIGTTIGVCAGYFGGAFNSVFRYLLTVRLAMPIVLVGLLILAIVEINILVVAILIGLLLWDRFAIVARRETIRVRRMDFVLSARALGARHLHIMWREILPNIANKLFIVATFEVSNAILFEAALSFLALGGPFPHVSWGLLVAEGRDLMYFFPWLVTLPTAALFIATLSINLLGNGIRKHLSYGEDDNVAR